MDITGALAIVLIFGGGTLFLLAISPVGRAIAERIRRSGGGALPEDVRGELDELRSELTGEVHQLRTEASEWTSPSGCSPSNATASGSRRRGPDEPRGAGCPDPHRRHRRVFRLDDRADLHQSVHGQAAGGEPGGPRARGEAGRGCDGAGAAAAGGGGTRGTRRFYRAAPREESRGRAARAAPLRRRKPVVSGRRTA